MSGRKFFGLACAIALSLYFSVGAWADTHSSRQYYGGWHRNARDGHHYRYYYYKPHANYYGYKHHTVIYNPRFGNYYYFYNPYKKVFWGRCPMKTNGKPLYSKLADQDRVDKLSQLNMAKFPEPQGVPAIPESEDGAEMELPPDDPPPGE
jgi:hypothetical protein